MIRLPYNYPQCSRPVVLINQNAKRLLFDGGTLYYDGKAVKIPNVNDISFKGFIKRGYKLIKDELTRHKIEDSYVVLGDKFEYFYLLVSCGKCAICGHKRQVDMINRSKLEAELYDCPPYFFTLTYQNTCLPKYGELCYSDVQKFFKRLRMKWKRQGLATDFRYIVAGEYGSRTHRPHYHVILFNNPYGASELIPDLHAQLGKDIFDVWGKCLPQGFDFGQCAGGASAYVTKYLTKQCKDTKHLFKPFVHASKGLGREFLARDMIFYHDNPSENVVRFFSKWSAKYEEVPFGSYVTQKVFPTPVRAIDWKAKEYYRQLVRLLPHMVSLDILTQDAAFEISEALRPSEYCRNMLSAKSPDKDFYSQRCWLSRSVLRKVVMRAFDDLVDELSVMDDVDLRKVDELRVQHRILMPQVQDHTGHLAPRYQYYQHQFSVQKSKETL